MIVTTKGARVLVASSELRPQTLLNTYNALRTAPHPKSFSEKRRTLVEGNSQIAVLGNW